jgi:hypothetical protein
MKALAVLSNCSKINNKKIFKIRSLAHYMHGSHSAAFRFCLSFLLQKAKLNHLFYEKGAPRQIKCVKYGQYNLRRCRTPTFWLIGVLPATNPKVMPS